LVTIEVKLVEMKCGECGINFAVPDYYYRELRSTEQSWYCPNGHCRIFRGETDKAKAKRLGKELEETKRWREYFENAYAEETKEHGLTKRSLSATKAAHTRTKNRIKNGVCPVCNRHFMPLQRHMEDVHPNYHMQ
jgi:hypothetical protein